jgi:UDP-N-acetylglucosamine acyltransferase
VNNPIHPTAIVDPSAKLGENVQIGPYSVIGAGVEIGDNTILAAHVTIEDRTILGADCRISSGAVIGGAPQDLAYQWEPTRVRIGNGTQIRECVTINRATGEGRETVVGDNCFLMAYSHLAHNCQVGNHVIIANLAQAGGYAQIGDFAFIGGNALIHQHCRVGRYAFLGGDSGIRQDIPPFSMNDGRVAQVKGINSIGLKRRGFTQEQRQQIKRAFMYLWFSGLNQTQAIEAIREKLEIDANIQELLDFIGSSKRGFNFNNAKALSNTNDTPEPQNLEALTV